jgi:hypothetical protein
MRKRKPAATVPASGTIEERDQPEVIVDFVFDRGLFHVAVANVSDAPAYLVSVKFDKKFRGLGGKREVSSLPLFRQIQFLAPRKRIETFLDTSSAYFQRREPTRITALISFRDARRRVYERRITHDLSIYEDVTYLLNPAGINSLSASAPANTTLVTREQKYGSPQR